MGIRAWMWALLSPPLPRLGVGLGEQLRQLPPVGQPDQGLRLPRPGVNAPWAAVPAKLGRQELQGVGPGLESQVCATDTGKRAAERPRQPVVEEQTSSSEQSDRAASPPSLRSYEENFWEKKRLGGVPQIGCSYRNQILGPLNSQQPQNSKGPSWRSLGAQDPSTGHQRMTDQPWTPSAQGLEISRLRLEKRRGLSRKPRVGPCCGTLGSLLCLFPHP